MVYLSGYTKNVWMELWNRIADFLQNRSAICILKNKPGDSFRTDLGLPQGSILSPLLFNIFLSDINNGAVCEKVKFADDGTVWKSGNNPQELAQCMTKDLQSFSKWRMKLIARPSTFYLQETQIMLFLVLNCKVKY